MTWKRTQTGDTSAANRSADCRPAVLAILLAALTTACTEERPMHGDSAPQGGAPDDRPVLSFLVEPAAVGIGSYVKLSWDALGAAGCEASGDWHGPRPATGQEQFGPVDRDSAFRLSCAGAGGVGVAHEVNVAVSGSAPPEVRLHAGQEQVPANGITQLNWNAENAGQCVASGGWSGDRPPSGQEMVGPIAQTTSFRLSCSSGNGTALASVTVQVAEPVAGGAGRRS